MRLHVTADTHRHLLVSIIKVFNWYYVRYAFGKMSMCSNHMCQCLAVKHASTRMNEVGGAVDIFGHLLL